MRLILATAFAAATAVLASWQDPPRRDARLQNLTLDAALTAPEFQADALLRIASASVVDAVWRRQLIDEAFMRAYGAQEPYRRSAFGIPAESRQGAMLLAYDSRLTQVSLQVRAVQMMALVDGPHARELFQWITPGVEATSCGELLVPAIAEYYTALSFLARTTFPPAERGEALRFLEYYLWRAHLPSEMPAVAQAILRFRPAGDEAAYLQLVLRFIFEGGGRDPRGFSASSIELVTRVGELDDRMFEIGVVGPHLARVLRDYLRSHLTGPRCADSASESVAVDTFNARVRRTGADKDGVPRLEAAEVRPSRTLAGANVDMYWTSSESRRLRADYLRLRGPGRNPIAISLRTLPTWRDQADRFVADLDHWNGAREPAERDYFYQKAVLFTEVLNLMPPGAARTRTLRSFIDFLRRADLERTRRALWFVFASRLLELAHGADRNDILDAMDTSGHATLSLYARLERLLPEQTRTGPGPARDRFPFAEESRHP